MEKDTKALEELELLISKVAASQHRIHRNKLIGSYPIAEADADFQSQALDYLLDILRKRAFSSQDSVYVLNLVERCLKHFPSGNQPEWTKVLEALGTFVRRQRLHEFLYNEKSDIDRVLVSVLRRFPKDLLATSLKNIKDYAVFHTLCKFFYLENELKAHSDVVVARLKEDFLVDKSKLNLRMTSYISKSILTDAIFEDLLAQAMRLVRRSESNLETLIVYLENVSFDISKRAHSLIFEDLKDLLGAKDKEKNIKLHRVFKAVISQVQDPAVSDKIFNDIAKEVNNNNQENAKVVLLQLLFFMVIQLPNNENTQGWTKSLLSLVSSSAALITGDEPTILLLEELRRFREFVRKSKTPIILSIDDKELTNLKKQVSNAGLNKNSFSTASSILTYLLESQREENADLVKDLGASVDSAYQNNVAANTKAIGKLVTAYTGFINALLSASVYLQKSENAKLEKALGADIVAMLDETAFVHSQKFYGKVNAEEISNWLKVFSLNSGRLSKGLKLTENKFSVLCSDLAETLAHPLISTKDIAEFFGQIQDKNFMYYAVVHGFFNKIYISTEAELEKTNVDRMRIALDYIVRDLESVDLTNELVLELLWLASSEKMNPNLRLRNLINRRLQKQGELKEKLLANIREQYDTIKGFLFSANGLFSKVQHRSDAAVNFATLLIQWGIYDILSEFKLFLSTETWKESGEIESFEEETSGGDFESEVSSYTGLLGKLGLTEIKAQEESKSADPKGAAKPVPGKAPVKGPAVLGKKTGKEAPAKNQKFVDPAELKKHQLGLLKAKMAGYMKPVASVLKKILRTRSTEAAQEYFARCHDLLKELMTDEVARAYVEEVFYVLLAFSPYKQVVKAAEYIVYVYFCRLCGIELRDQDIADRLDQFIEGFRKLKDLEISKMDTNYANIVYEACQYVLVSEEIENTMKGPALAIIIKIGTTGGSSELGSEILQMMIDYLDTICQYQETQGLFNVLLGKYSENVADSLFSYILDYEDNAKVLVLKALTEVEKPALFAEFEKYVKIMILALDENKNITKFAVPLLEKYKLAITKEHLEKFNLKDFVNAESNDSIEKFCKIVPELLKEAPGAGDNLVEKAIEGAQSLINNPDISKMEDALMFLPTFVENAIPQCKEFLPKIFEIFVEQYCVETYPLLMEKTIEVGSEAIRFHGKEKGDFVLGFLEKYLDKKYPAQVNVTAIIFMGTCAPFLKDKSKVKPICDKIMITANNPSDHVKRNIAKGLPELIGFFENPNKIAQDLLDSLQTEKDTNKMKGSAYLLSGFVKGLGVKFIEDMNIFGFLEQNVEGKKVLPTIKLAIISLIQALIENLGKTFEPYYLKVLQILMNFYGEQQEDIRLSSLKCTKIMMSFLSAFGVKQVLPQLLKGIEEKTWRAKVASISVLGNMAFCAPKQLSACLPQIVPKLAQALSDPHPTVQEKGNQALSEIGSTITSPEISEISEILIKALSNPYDENKKGLEVLLQTQFVHYIDTASLSLIIPVIEYGLRNRDSTLRKNASQLIGSISNLIKNTGDLDPYQTMLINALKMAICDTLSEVRAIAAKACGSLCQKLGLEKSADLILAIQEILESGESNTIDRAGAAQAMSEITYALGKSYIDQVLPVYLANTTSNQVHIRESYIGIFAFLPAIMEEEFEPYIADVVDNIIDAISDENEIIRNLSIRVVKILIQRFGLKKTDILMDPAESGLFSPNWRRRASSVLLVGEMLEILQKSERRAKDSEIDYVGVFTRIVTSLHILKFDHSEHVKHTSNAIWKTYVENTPKTLKQILPALIDKLIYILAEVEENVEMAEICIHEFGSKYAESMFRDIYAILEAKKKQYADKSQSLKAFCELVSFLTEAMNDDFVEAKKDGILVLIKDLLITSDDYIRASACQVLEGLLDKCRKSNLIEEIVPTALEQLEGLNENDAAYDNYLKFFDEIIGFESGDHLEYLGECLFEAPLTQYKLDIITNNAEVFAPEMYQEGFFGDAIDSLFGELLNKEYNEDIKQSIIYCINQISIHLDESKLSKFFNSCYQLIEPRNLKTDINKIYVGLEVLHFYFHNTTHEFFSQLDVIFTNISPYLTSENGKIIELINEILGSILNSLDQEQCYLAIKPLNRCIENSLQLGTKNASSTISAFNAEEGLDPYLNVVIKALVYGPLEIFEQTLITYEFILEYTEKGPLEKYAVKLVGPLIRVAFYKYENEFKARVVSTILKFAEKGISLVMLLPQLQTTFVRLILEYNGDPSYLRSVCEGLNYVIENSKKRDYLLNDLLTKFVTADSDWKKFAHLYCIYKVIKKNPKLFSKALLDKIGEKVQAVKDLSVGSEQNKYIGRVFAFLTTLEVVTKQKDVMQTYLDKLDSPSDKEYLNFEKFMSLLLLCDSKLVEQFDATLLEKKIGGFMGVIKHKGNVIPALQGLKKLKEKSDKVRSTLAQSIIDHNDFRSTYNHLGREEEVEALLSIL